MNSRSLYQFLVFFVCLCTVLLVNQLAHLYHFRWDLTEEKRYTLHPSTINGLNQLTDVIDIEVFLEGELPANFKRLKMAIRETLEQFAHYGGYRIQFRFSDPALAVGAKARDEYYRSLMKKGIPPSNVSYSKNGQKTEKLIFPGALITFQGRELGIPLLKGNTTLSVEDMLNRAIEGLEYELSSGIKRIQSNSRRRIGLITGHGEPDTTDLAGMTLSLIHI